MARSGRVVCALFLPDLFLTGFDRLTRDGECSDVSGTAVTGLSDNLTRNNADAMFIGKV
ncbi:hypothetical protein SAMN05216333_11175 [Nitrosomonas oligotropha]|uniref:Uncharacterized protein n=1 Tax=Nitrosomonas oligotropha TaxID=42354 RepID=A0A1H8QBL3_9PROT|nr:hypothetical protein SAMN05216300_10976 [Nitrosomonas oligotropha]SEO51609.1 hypothetical protein SAMN05216333_11175 [Nitrosomonas oligotropha]